MKAKKVIKATIIVMFAIVIAALYSYGNWPRAIYDTSVGASKYENSGEIYGDMELKQSFVCANNGFNGLSIKLSKLGHAIIGTYEWSVTEKKSGKVIGHGVISEHDTENSQFNSSNVQKSGLIKLNFERQTNSKNTEYVFIFKAKNVSQEEDVALYITQRGNLDRGLSIENNIIDRTAVIKLEYKRFNRETFIVFLGIFVYLAFFIKFMYRLFN